MQRKLGIVLLCLGVIALAPRSAFAQQSAVPEDTSTGNAAPPAAVAPASIDTTPATLAGCGIGLAVGFGIAALLYVSTAPDPDSEALYEGLDQVFVMTFVGIPLLAGTTVLGGIIGESMARPRPMKARAPTANRGMTVTPVAGASPDGAYLGARVRYY
jgi:hypothetical protein